MQVTITIAMFGPPVGSMRFLNRTREHQAQTVRSLASACASQARRPLDEIERRLGDLAPAVVDREGGPRFGIFTISVTPGLRLCHLKAALAIAHGTVWSFSPSMMSRGPRSGFFVYRRLLVQRSDDLGGVIGDLPQRLLGEDLRICPGYFNRFRIIRPARRQRDVPGLLE